MALVNWIPAVALAISYILVGHVLNTYLKSRKRSPYPLPPGPPALPIVGNIRGIDANAPWLTYMDWGKTYGDLIYSRLFGQEIVVINSEKLAKDLLDKRSSNYSDRPFLMTDKLFGSDFNTIFMRYGDRWRRQRRFFHQSFKSDATTRFKPMQQEKAHNLLQNLLESPDLLWDHLLHYASSVILKAVYDYDAMHKHDEMVVAIENAFNLLLKFVVPKFVVILNAFPMLIHFPLWPPSIVIKKTIPISRKLMKEMLEGPFKHARQRLDDGSTSPAMVFDGLRKVTGKDSSTVGIEDLKEASGTAFMAASESSHSILTNFILAMVLFPEAQAKAQAEIDSVCGKDRLPTFDDRPLLTYIDAIMRETMRWAPIGPLLPPHNTLDDDVYNGYYIPKGAMVIANPWAMSRNEEKYPKPSEFIPERFLQPDGKLTDDNVVNLTFGYGRRICVGRYFADNTLWIAMSMILAVFRLSPPKGEDGREVPIDVKWSSGATRHSLPFAIDITPRILGFDLEKLDQMISARA